MSHDAPHFSGPHGKLVYMANQIAKFMESKPHAEGVAGLSSHINDFWEPRMRRHLFEVLDAGGTGLRPLVLDAAAKIKRPAEAA
jgi:formate dehydrogenase subunit delta